MGRDTVRLDWRQALPGVAAALRGLFVSPSVAAARGGADPAFLTAFVNTLISTTDTPGAAPAGVPAANHAVDLLAAHKL